MMKKIICILLSLILCGIMISCKENEAQNQSTDSGETENQSSDQSGNDSSSDILGSDEQSDSSMDSSSQSESVTDSKEEENVKTIDVYIIAGQSNAAGLTRYNESELKTLWSDYKNGTENVLFSGFCQDQTIKYWENAKAGQGTSASQMGPEVGMAAVLSEEYYNGDKYAGIIKHAYGGTSIFNNLGGYNDVCGNWLCPSYAQEIGASYTGKSGGLYRGLLQTVEENVAKLERRGFEKINIKGLFWMQGENDRLDPKNYAKAFSCFATDIRRDLGKIMGEDLSSMPIIVGEISRTTKSASPSTVVENDAFIAMQRRLPVIVNDVYVVNSSKYEVNTWDAVNNKDINVQDNYHWSTQHMFGVGELVGRCIIDNILNAK